MTTQGAKRRLRYNGENYRQKRSKSKKNYLTESEEIADLEFEYENDPWRTPAKKPDPVLKISENWFKTHRFYFITIAKHQVKDFVDIGDIQSVMTELQRRRPSFRELDHCYEISPKYHQLHYHGILQCDNFFFKFTENNSIQGFKIHYKQIRSLQDIARVRAYIWKDAYNKYAQEQIILDNVLSNKYSFI